MEIEFTAEEQRKRKLMVMTPMYGGQCFLEYTMGMCGLMQVCTQMGIQVVPYFMSNESLIQRARNYCVDAFLESDCTHAIFIDADVGFEPSSIVMMLAMMSDDSPYDVLTAAYPKKCISWEKVQTAVEKGVGEDDPQELSNYVGDYVLTPLYSGSVDLSEPFEIAEAGTGFMMVRRKTFERIREANPDQEYLPDHIRSDAFDGKRHIHAFFDCGIDENKRYLSEDYWFCRSVRKAGMKLWLCPFMPLTHTGTMKYGGSLRHLATINADPTAASVAVKKAKKKADEDAKKFQKALKSVKGSK